MVDTQLCPTAQKILQVLLQTPGTHCTAEDVGELVDCAPTHVCRSLDRLADVGVIERWETGNGKLTYVART